MHFFARIPNWVYLTLFVALALVQVWLLRNTVMGDAFIHFVFARGIVEGHPFFYNGDFSAGSTSPLWSAFLAPLWALLGDGIIPGVKVLASIFVATSVVLTYIVAERISKSRVLALIASFLLATSFVLPFWAAKGMETPLATSLVLVDFLIYFRLIGSTEYHTGKFPISNFQFLNNFQWFNFLISKQFWLEICLGLMLGFTILCRPEGWILAGILGCMLLWQQRWRTVVTVGLPALIVIAPYYYLVFLHTGQIFPSSMARVLHARQFVHETLGIFWTTEIIKMLVTKFLPLTPFFVWFAWEYFRGDDGVVGGKVLDNLEKLKRGFLTVLGMQKVADRRYVFIPIFIWLAFHLFFFTFVMPMTQGYRYLLPAMPFFYTLALIGAFRINEKCKMKNVKYILFGFIVVFSVAISAQQLIERTQVIAACEVPHIDAVRRLTGEWLRDHTKPTDLIAIKEVDQSAYYSGRRVLSMDGTLNLAAVPFVKTHDQLGYLQTFRPEYVVLEEDMYRLYPEWQTSNLIPLLDHELNIGDTKTVGTATFTLAHKIRLGDATECSSFQGEYFWYFYKIGYTINP